MLTSYKIQDAIYQSKQYSIDLLDELVTKQGQGEDVCVLQKQYIVFIKWIEILEAYLSENFDSNGTITDPEVVCLTADEIEALIAKMKVARGGNRYTPSPWVIATGYWNDLGKWIDGETWFDNVPIV